ncbi:uncharacterized protein LOC6525052 [Drosophila yakuba]|nr:uncharacterized protein LOC6525052 [Drosophila yakuba]
MKTLESDDKPFNPFYIGPHPSKACAIPEIPGRQCSPNCQEQVQPAATTTNKSPTGAVASNGSPTELQDANSVPTGTAGGMLIVGVANIYSTVEVLAAAARMGGAAGTGAAAVTGADQGPPAPSNTICKPYPCMEGARSDSPGCG